MEQEILQKLSEMEQKIDQTYAAVEKLRKYFLWTLIISVGAVLVPLLGLIAIAPWFIGTMMSAYTLN